jgi:hypothetical protein
MKTIAIKMKSYSPSVNIVNNGNLESRILNILLWSFGALALCYVLFLGNMVFNIIKNKSLEVSVRTLQNEVGNLQSQYFFVSNKIDFNLAQSMGFKETSDKQYATRRSFGSVKLATNEL